MTELKKLEFITESEFVRFRDFFYRKTGIRFENSKRYFVDKRLIDRAIKTGYSTFNSYFTWMRLEASQTEFQTLVNAMTVNETYFYREDYQFQALIESALGEVIKHKRKGSEIKIWSVPSSTGEEPYSIVLHLLEYWRHLDDYEVEIVSSDIDSNVLNSCYQGIYGERSIKHIPKATLNRYFTPIAGNKYQLSKDIRESVTFTMVNLANSQETRGYRNFDIVFCRNLLIYFDDSSRREAAETLYDALNPGGFVFLGHSESMSRISSLFKVRKFPKAIVYQKPLDEA